MATNAMASVAAATEASLALATRQLIQQLRAFSTCDVGDTLLRLGVKGGGYLYGIKPPPTSGTSWKICGQAVTVRMCNYGGAVSPTNLKPFVEYNEPGKIMIIETPEGRSSKASACWGAVESVRAKALLAEGVIISGNMRQVSDCQEVGFPVFSRGTAALGTRQYMRIGKVKEKITISANDIRPDDVLMADENGVIVVRLGMLEEVVQNCEDLVKENKMILKDIKAGQSMSHAIKRVTFELGTSYEKNGPLRR